MSEMNVVELVAELDRGAEIMRDAKSDNEKLSGARIISQVGETLVSHGGKSLLEMVHLMVAPEHQRTVENQWFGLTDKDGQQWLL